MKTPMVSFTISLLAAWLSLPGSKCKRFYFDFIGPLSDLRKIILCLLDHPAFGATPKALRSRIAISGEIPKRA